MNHEFVKSAWNQLVCAKCALAIDKHVVLQCEACSSNDTSCKLIDGMYLCASCAEKHTSAKLTTQVIPPEINDGHKIERIVNQANRLIETDQIQSDNGASIRSIIENAVKGNINEFKDFFNAKIPSIIELTTAVENDETITDKKYEVAKLLKGRLQHLSHVLFEFNHKSLEMSAEVKCVQQYMNQLIPSLRIEQRNQFAENNIDYNPPTIKKPSAPKVRLSNEDKMAEMYAKSMHIPIEQARKLLAQRLRQDCTCKETPGMCPVHKS